MTRFLYTALAILFCLLILVPAGFAQQPNEVLKRAISSIQAGNNEAAIKDLTDALKTDANNSEILATRAHAYINLKNYEAALVDSSRATALSPNFGWAYYLHGVASLWQSKKDFGGAMADFTKVIALDPKLAAEGYRFRAGIHNEFDKDFWAALADANEAVKLNPTDGNAYAQRGWANTQLNNFEKARDDYRQSIKYNFATGAVYTTLGFNEFKLKDYAQAAIDTRKALELDPNNQDAKNNLANILTAQAEQSKAVGNTLESFLQEEMEFFKLVSKYPDAAEFLGDKKKSDQTEQNTNGGSTQSESRKNFLNLTAEFNTLRKIYDEKSAAYFPIAEKESARFNRNLYSPDKKTAEDRSIRVAYCKALLELDPAITNLQKIAVALKEMDKNGEAGRAASAQELAVMRDALKQWTVQELYRPISIAVDECRGNPTAKEITLEEFAAASKIETRNRIIEILIKLGDLPGYFTAGKKISTLTTSSTQAEICQVTSEFKKESEMIEPLLEEFAKIYVLEIAPEYADPDKPARTVEFDNPEITKQAEKLLELRTKLFLPKKEQLKIIRSKHDCQ